MTAHPAFEEALRTGNHSALLSLYTAALAQRDRAEAIIRALLNPATSTQTVREVTGDDEGNIYQTNAQSGHTIIYNKPSYKSPPNPPTQAPAKSVDKQPKSTKLTAKPNLADSI